MKRRIFGIVISLLIINLVGCNTVKDVSSVSKAPVSYDYDYYDYDPGEEDAEIISDTSSGESVSQGTSASSNTGGSTETQGYDPSSYNVNTDWFMNAKYGIFVHYLYNVQNNSENISGLSQGKQTSWNECVNDFNVDTFAKNMSDAGAAYVMFSILQSTRYMIAPNETFNKYTGYKTGEACSTRDLIADLIVALDKYKIKLMLYYTADGPSNDGDAAQKLGVSLDTTPEFRRKWYEIGKEYSLRYKDKVHGWWIDGAHLGGYNDETLAEFANALKAGNPKSIVAFNKGGAAGMVRYTSGADDYIAGESNFLGTEKAFLTDIPASRFINPDFKINRQQWHALSYLGSNWGMTDIKYDLREFVKYLKTVNSRGGVISMDIGVYRDGSVAPRQMDFLKEVKAQIR